MKILEAINISYAYDFKNSVFKNVSFDLEEGEFWGVLGKNGAGKTSLIELLVGFRWPDEGVLKIFGNSIRTKDKNFLKHISFLSHDVQIASNQKVSEFLEFHSVFYENYSKTIEIELIDYFGVDSNVQISSLSTGQQKKIQIIAALSAGTKLLIIDEITAVLDPETRAKFFIKLYEHSKKFKKTIILATNLFEDLEKYANKILFVDKKTASVKTVEEMKSLLGNI